MPNFYAIYGCRAGVQVLLLLLNPILYSASMVYTCQRHGYREASGVGKELGVGGEFAGVME